MLESFHAWLMAELAKLEWTSLALAAATVMAALLAAWLVHHLSFGLLARIAIRTRSPVDDSLARRARAPTRWILFLLATFLVLPALRLSNAAEDVVQRVLVVALTGVIGWLALRLTHVLNDVVESKYDLAALDSVTARQTLTRVRILTRVLTAIIVTVTACLMLMAIPSIRQIGVTLFASAGIAGLVVGMAARPAISNLLAGIQLALTQPIRIEDAVTVEGQFGWIEEIRPTYVVVRVWDLRRLIVPISHFIEKPFENWTRGKTDALGAITVFVDYAVSIPTLREEALRVLKSSELWDGKVANVQVTDCRENSVEVRVLMSASSSGRLWDLRCFVREQLVEHLSRQQRDGLPRQRTQTLPSRDGGRDGERTTTEPAD